MLGSLLMFLSTGTTLQSLVSPLIPQQYLPNNWGGSYDQKICWSYWWMRTPGC